MILKMHVYTVYNPLLYKSSGFVLIKKMKKQPT